ncbi:MAG: SEC-C metal-binding domain-containing protein [Armatimonadetes bacterium]|nr:SEC-C metal-binding domain-containing protein [Armatimonadota bacterium]
MRASGFQTYSRVSPLQEKLGRNDLCPCGSGRKFRACCRNSGHFDGAERHYYF